MSRYVNVFRTGLSPQEVKGVIGQYLQGEGFKYQDERGEMVWRKGTGALANPQFIKAESAGDGTVRVEAWTAGVSLLPGIYGGELNPMQGGYGFAVKMALKPRVLELERRLGGTPAGQVGQSAAQAGQPIASSDQSPAAAPTVRAAWYPDPTHRHEMRYWDGMAWTANVADQGQASTDPIGSA